MGTTNTNKRLHARTPLVLAARFDAGREAIVLDLSVGGARLEHQGALRPGAECRLRFALNDEVYLFNAGVIWSRAVPGRAGGSGGRFHSGLAFERVPAVAQSFVAALVAASN